jgi:NitT/TauT family transport system ATP-binding protein
MIEIKNLWKSYGDTQVLERVNAQVSEGEFITLVGTSGCGKSTFLKMLLGTERQSSGELLLDGQPIPDEPDRNRGIVFQQYSVFPHLSVLKNVMAARAFDRGHIGALLLGRQRREARLEAEQLLESVGLSHALDHYPHELSGGMRQRLAIAQALVLKPRILLLDEPFGALDPGIRGDMHGLLLDLWHTQKLTVFMVTHDLKEGFYLGTRLWVFDKVRHDPHQPQSFGATITYDIPVGRTEKQTYEEIDNRLRPLCAA